MSNHPKHVGILPLRNDVFFPGAVLQLAIGRPASVALLHDVQDEDLALGIVSQRVASVEEPSAEDLYDVGTYATVISVMRTGEDRFQVLVKGTGRFRLKRLDESGPFLTADVAPATAEELGDPPEDSLVKAVKTDGIRYVSLRPDLPERSKAVVRGIRNPGRLADVLAAHLEVPIEARQDVLATFSLKARLDKVQSLLESECNELKVSQRIHKNMDDERSKHQREQYLRHKMKAIREELGGAEDDEDFLDEIEQKLDAQKIPEHILKVGQKELKRLRTIPPQSAEFTVARTYLEWLTDLPWGEYSDQEIDLDQAEEVLDRDHFGLEKPKSRIVEFIAVHKLKQAMRGPILCLVGPPGVGKSSLARSMAAALGRRFVRMSLGGVRDEAEVRGHRRTYVGSMPGRLVKALKQAGTMNPVILLDEVDKLSADFRGDPSAALLEVLDPEQNHEFLDHYLDVGIDLSRVLFVATANALSTVPAALIDRLEVIEVSSYTHTEKKRIGTDHLLPKQLDDHGLEPSDLSLSEASVEALIERYTREAGVRQLDRELAALCRKGALAKVRQQPALAIGPEDLDDLLGPRKYYPETLDAKPVPGIATGLAWTSVGGAVLYVEATAMPGKGKLQLTGSLGEVMKESAQAVLSYVRAHAVRLGLADQADRSILKDLDLHIHFPAGATPKDGPSAGVALLASVVSLLRGVPVRDHLAMTGEITLRGLVLPVGGIKEKVLAAHRAGIERVLIPVRNQKDLIDVPAEVLAEIEVVPIEHMSDVIEQAFDDSLPTLLHDSSTTPDTPGHLRQ
jgi:ATP-dependent Lon protease